VKPANLVFLLLSMTVAFLLAAVGSESTAFGLSLPEWQFFGSNTYAELEKAPEKSKSRPNPLENDPEAVAAGRLLFEDHCAECHGDDAGGARKGPSLRVSEVAKATPGTLFWVLSNGVVRKKMPSWSKLPEPQRWQVVRYLKSLGAR
jgi:mono/diheme cytochrome c family protein